MAQIADKGDELPRNAMALDVYTTIFFFF